MKEKTARRLGKQQTERMAVQTALIDCPGKFVSLVEWLGRMRASGLFLLLLRVRGEKVTDGGFDCALFGVLLVEPF